MEDENKEEQNNSGTTISETVENTSSPDSDIDLDIDTDLGEDDVLPPPEDQNEARTPNIGYILGIGMCGILVILLIIFIGSIISGKKNKKESSSELEKAGSKTVIEFKDKTPVEYESSVLPDESVTKSEEDIDEAINSLPSGFQLPSQSEVGKAPIAPTGSTHSAVSDRPDTRNSKSLRKIEGLGGLDFSSNAGLNASTISQYLSGNYGTNASGQKMSKEEFIAQQMAQTQKLQNSLYGNGFGTSGTGSGVDKENFFTNGINNSNRGEYLNSSTLWDGTIISGALVTAINTDNPGVVIARVTENVYSSQDHSYLLIPEGSLLMATYNSSVSYGQDRVQVAWNLLIRPDNYRVQLGNMNGVNAQGASGYEGSVSNHPFETLKALGMVAMFSIIQTEVTKDINSQSNEYLKNSMTDVYSEASKLGNKILNKALDIKPTIKIKEGTEIKLITNTPLELPPVEINRATQKYVRNRK